MTVTGAANTVTLAGSTLSPTLGYDPAATDRLFILDNQTNTAAGGTFGGLPEGSTFTMTNPNTGNMFTAFVYYSGDVLTGNLGGNDVLIAFQPVPEPSAVLAVCAAGAVVVRLVRRRRSAGRSGSTAPCG